MLAVKALGAMLAVALGALFSEKRKRGKAEKRVVEVANEAAGMMQDKLAGETDAKIEAIDDRPLTDNADWVDEQLRGHAPKPSTEREPDGG